MVTYKSAKRVVRIGRLFAVFGTAIGLAVWLGAFSGDLARPAIFFIWPLGVGGVISGVGMILEKRGNQPDVGRQ